MHMSDALLTPAVGGVMYAASTGSLGYAVRKVNKEMEQSALPLMAISGAFVFTAQMINFTIPATGSSGHIGGGILLAGLIGGAPALLTLAAVLIIQCLFFADGGLLALGANIFNMGVIPCLLIYPLIFRPILRKKITAGRITLASILSAVIGLQLGAFGVVLETLASGITELPFSQFVLFMQPIHLAIGIVEGIITAAVLNFVYSMQPEILRRALGVREDGLEQAQEKATAEQAGVSRQKNRKVFVAMVVLTLLVGGILSLYASANPDGLEWSVAQVTGEEELEDSSEVVALTQIQEATAVMPDYDFKSEDADTQSSVISGTSVAGIAGGAVTFLLAGLIGLCITLFRKKKIHV